MYRFKKSLITLIGVLTLVGIVTIAMPHVGRSASGTNNSAPTSQTQNVNVVNSPAVNAQQSGTWNVGINGMPSVTVANFPVTSNVAIDSSANTVKIDTSNSLAMRDVENPARQPFQTEFLSAEFPDGVAVNFSPLTTVPQGKRLVIEQVSVVGGMLLGQKMVQAGIQVSQNENNVRHNLIVTAQGTSGCCRDIYVASQQVRLYADAGSSVLGFAVRNTTTGYANLALSYSISGYMIDAP
jgi:hypothetical protein